MSRGYAGAGRWHAETIVRKLPPPPCEKCLSGFVTERTLTVDYRGDGSDVDTLNLCEHHAEQIKRDAMRHGYKVRSRPYRPVIEKHRFRWR